MHRCSPIQVSALSTMLLLTLLASACGAADGGGGGDAGPAGGGDDATPVSSGDVWQPEPGTSWQWQLSGTIDTGLDVAMYDVDLFDVPDAVIEALHDDGRIVICYFSAGTFEDWRTDAERFPSAAIGRSLPEWEGESWLDTRDETVRTIMAERLDLAVARGCDGVEPDNMDAFDNDNGFALTPADQLGFNRFIADEAHARGLSVGLKNDLPQVEALVDWYDWALNEECVTYGECERLTAFLQAGKAVFHTEYVDDPADGPALRADVCAEPSREGFSTLIKEWDLGPWRLACD